MELSVKEFCKKYSKSERYTQRLLQANRLDLIPEIKSFRKIGHNYLVKIAPVKK